MTTGLDFTPDESRAMRYCAYCPRLCRHACPVAHGEARETTTPWGLMRLLHFAEKGFVASDDALLETISHCVSCGRCQSFCLHDNPVAEVLAKGRSQLVASGATVAPHFQTPAGGCEAHAPLPPRRNASESTTVFLPACAHLADEQSRDRLSSALTALDQLGIPVDWPEQFTGCGYHEWEVGLTGAAEQSWERYTHSARAAAITLTDCASSLRLERERRQEPGGPIHLIEWLSAHLTDLPPGDGSQTVAVHDSCSTSRHLGLGGLTREVVQRLTGSEPKDLFESGRHARCCGSTGQWATAFPPEQARATATVVDDIADSGADLVVTGSPSCRASLARQVAERGLAIEVLDLLDLVVRSATRAGAADPTADG